MSSEHEDDIETEPAEDEQESFDDLVEDLDELGEEGLEDDLDEDALVGDEIDADLADDELEEEIVEDLTPAPARPRTDAKEEEDDDEEPDPDDVEADLDTILKDRLEAYDDDEEEEGEDEVQAPAAVDDEDGLPQKKEGEFPCPSCFLLVSPAQLHPDDPVCPHCGDMIVVPSGR
ncbi:MAG: hypothetical protein ACKVWR_10505 [Acidimicrobiales bacterium]